MLVRLPSRLVLAATLASAVIACSSSDGRGLPPADPRITTTSVSAPVVGQPSDDRASEVFTLDSPAFAQLAAIPRRHTCSGVGVSPPLTWASTPPEAVELAIVVRDRSAGGFVHWTVTGIDPAVQGIGEGGIPEGAFEARNDGGTIGWFAPCPPVGSTHTYVFSIHAVTEPIKLGGARTPAAAAAAVERASESHAQLLGTVER